VAQQVAESHASLCHGHGSIVRRALPPGASLAGNWRAARRGGPWVASNDHREHTVQLTIHTPETAPAASKETLEGIAADIRSLPTRAGPPAGAPALMRAFDGLRRAVGSGDLDPVARDVAGLAVGVAVDN